MQAITPTHIIWLKRHLGLYMFNDERAQALKESILAYDEKKQDRHQAELLYDEFLKLFSNNMFYYGFRKKNQSISSNQFDAYLVFNKYDALTPIGLMREVKGEIEYPYDKAKAEYENTLKEQARQLEAVGGNSKKKKYFDAIPWNAKPMFFRAAIAAVLLAVVGIKLFMSKDIIIDEVKNGGLFGKIIWGIAAVLLIIGVAAFVGELAGAFRWFRYTRAIKWADRTIQSFNEEMDEVINRKGMTGKDQKDRELVDDWLNDFRVQVDSAASDMYKEELIGPRNMLAWKDTDRYQVKLIETMGKADRTLPYAETSMDAQMSECGRNMESIRKMWKKGANWKKSFGPLAYVAVILLAVFLFVCVGKIDYCKAISEGFSDLTDSSTEKDKDPAEKAVEQTAGEKKDENRIDIYATEGYERISVKSVEASSERGDSSSSYSAGNTIDGKYDTCWQDGIEGDGINEYLLYTFDKPRKVAYITICNGNPSSGSEYRIGSRPKQIGVEIISNGRTLANYPITVSDDGKQEEIRYDLPGVFECDAIKLKIMQVYEGISSDTALSEVGIYAKTESGEE